MFLNNFDNNIHGRRSIRLKGYDYSRPGAYFITLCAYNRECLFGNIVYPPGDGQSRGIAPTTSHMLLNETGRLISETWSQIPSHYQGIYTDSFVIMPNHIHGIVIINNPAKPYDVGADPCVRPLSLPCVCPLSLPRIVKYFKTMTTKRYTDTIVHNGWYPKDGKLWQRNYYDHIINNDYELNEIRQYIQSNTGKWESDQENPDNPLI